MFQKVIRNHKLRLLSSLIFAPVEQGAPTGGGGGIEAVVESGKHGCMEEYK